MMKPMSVTLRSDLHGFILVAVLWILGALAALISIYGVFVINTATGFSIHEDRLRTEALVSAALELTANRQFSTPAQSRVSHGEFAFRLGGANVAVDYRSEAARIDLNMAPKELLVGLFLALGERAELAVHYADRVIEWRTTLPKGQSVENNRPLERFEYTPRRAKFPHVNELSLVRDLPPAVTHRALPFLTVYSNRPQVNIVEAAPEVIAALPGMTPDRVRAVLAQRKAFPDNKQALLSMLGAAQQYATTEGSKTLRVSTQVNLESGRRMTAEVVILVFDTGNEPFSILSWQGDLDEPQASDGMKRAL